MSSVTRVALAALLLSAAAACGQKGPLTLPPRPGPEAATEPANAADEAGREDERQDDE